LEDKADLLNHVVVVFLIGILWLAVLIDADLGLLGRGDGYYIAVVPLGLWEIGVERGARDEDVGTVDAGVDGEAVPGWVEGGVEG
jgi:hypothetical protein